VEARHFPVTTNNLWIQELAEAKVIIIVIIIVIIHFLFSINWVERAR
jgi:hypothetical protein